MDIICMSKMVLGDMVFLGENSEKQTKTLDEASYV